MHVVPSRNGRKRLPRGFININDHLIQDVERLTHYELSLVFT